MGATRINTVVLAAVVITAVAVALIAIAVVITAVVAEVGGETKGAAVTIAERTAMSESNSSIYF